MPQSLRLYPLGARQLQHCDQTSQLLPAPRHGHCSHSPSWGGGCLLRAGSQSRQGIEDCRARPQCKGQGAGPRGRQSAGLTALSPWKAAGCRLAFRLFQPPPVCRPGPPGQSSGITFPSCTLHLRPWAGSLLRVPAHLTSGPRQTQSPGCSPGGPFISLTTIYFQAEHFKYMEKAERIIQPTAC